MVTGCWQGTRREKLYNKLGWESLAHRRWARRLTIFYKISQGLTPSYLSDHIPERSNIGMELRNRAIIPPMARTDRYNNSFFPYTIREWNVLDEATKSKSSIQSFKKELEKFTRPSENSYFDVRDR